MKHVATYTEPTEGLCSRVYRGGVDTPYRDGNKILHRIDPLFTVRFFDTDAGEALPSVTRTGCWDTALLIARQFVYGSADGRPGIR